MATHSLDPSPNGGNPHTCLYCQNEIIEPKSELWWNSTDSFHTNYTFSKDGTGALEAAANGCAFWDWYIRDFLDESSKLDYRGYSPNQCSFELGFDNYSMENYDKMVYPYELSQVYIEASHSFSYTIIGSLHWRPDDPASRWVKARRQATPVDTDENFALARNWMETCQQSHEGCIKPSGEFKPTRLLKIISADVVRLHTPTVRESVRWAALTYCWGGFQPVQTTKHTLDLWLRSIPVSELPKTIRDAIRTTWKIGLQYLWLDCLCIIQDDIEDIAKEISFIPKIYKNAEVTISAARSWSSGEGFLHDITIPTPQDEAFRLPFRCPDGQIGSIIIYGQDNLIHRRDPIESRAWTLQEHILSPRVLIFGSRQIWWTCRKVHTNWTGRSFTEYSEIGEIRLRFFNLKVSQRRRWLSFLPGHTWLSLVQHYSDRKLTFADDKLSAISGIAEHYGSTMSDQYIAGHFRSSLLSSLLWRPISEIYPRLANYRAPSWSWAAIDGQIRWEVFRSPTAPSLELIDCTLQLASEEFPYGAVKACSLTLQGRVRRVLWSRHREYLFDFNPDNKLESKYRAETIPDAIDHVSDDPTTVYCLEVCGYNTDDAIQNENRRSLPGHEVKVFGKLKRVRRPGLPKGLLLYSDDEITFKRVGLFSFRDVEDLLVSRSKREDVEFRAEVEMEKKLFFEGCDTRVITMI